MSLSNIELGLCCINTELRNKKPPVFPNRTCRLKTAKAKDKGLKYVKSLALQNLKDVLTILDWNYKNEITAYRMSSDMFPHASNPRFGREHKKGTRYGFSFAKSYLSQIGEKAHTLGIRLSMHPSQFNQIGSPNETVFKNTVTDLLHHVRILELIERGRDWGDKKGIICIHGGGVYKNKQHTIERWISRFNSLPQKIKDRICLENCEKCYSVEDCLYICNIVNIPLIFDTHHYSCYSLLHPDVTQLSPSELIPKVLETWKRRELKPYFHISEQGSGKTGHHSDYINEIPSYLFDVDVPFTLDVEAKCKEQAILKLMNLYK